MQHDTTTCNMIQQHTTRWSNGTNFFFTANVACCCMKSWDRLAGALHRGMSVGYSFWVKAYQKKIYFLSVNNTDVIALRKNLEISNLNK